MVTLIRIISLLFCLLLFSEGYSQKIRNPRYTKKVDLMLNPFKVIVPMCNSSSDVIHIGDTTMRKVIEPKPVEWRCGTPDVRLRDRSDTIYTTPLETLTVCDVLPSLKNDLKLLHDTIHYPAREKESGIMGTCFGFLKINTKGLADSIWVARAPTKNIERAVYTALKSLPRFVPARHKGKPVEAICFYKIRFHIF